MWIIILVNLNQKNGERGRDEGGMSEKEGRGEETFTKYCHNAANVQTAELKEAHKNKVKNHKKSNKNTY